MTRKLDHAKSVRSAHSDLKAKVRDVLNEARILVLGTQVLLGFQYQALFLPVFARMPVHARWMNLGALVLNVLVLCLLLAPAPFHRIAENGDDTVRLQHFSAAMIAIALPLLAVSLALEMTLVTEGDIGSLPAILLGAAIVLAAGILWIAIGLANRKSGNDDASQDERERASLAEKIQTLLTEARVILPGAQALLGFQFAAMLSDRFQFLPHASRMVHIGSLFAMALAVILLIAPAAYHRIAAGGEARDDVDTFGARMVLGALIPLAAGLIGDLYVISESTFDLKSPALAAAGVAVVTFSILWLVYPLLKRGRREP